MAARGPLHSGLFTTLHFVNTKFFMSAAFGLRAGHRAATALLAAQTFPTLAEDSSPRSR